MKRVIQRRSVKEGLPAGTLVHIGERKVDKTRLSVIAYDATHFDERSPSTVEECACPAGQADVTWINVDGVHDTNAFFPGCWISIFPASATA
jgi:magnesium transporter